LVNGVHTNGEKDLLPPVCPAVHQMKKQRELILRVNNQQAGGSDFVVVI